MVQKEFVVSEADNTDSSVKLSDFYKSDEETRNQVQTIFRGLSALKNNQRTKLESSLV